RSYGDWSSDVCSSDLDGILCIEPGLLRVELRLLSIGIAIRFFNECLGMLVSARPHGRSRCFPNRLHGLPAYSHQATQHSTAHLEIGRASCREGVVVSV